MKVTVDQNEFVRRFLAIRPEKFSHEALVALFDYLDAEEEALGEEQYLDVIGICSEWTEYPSSLEAAKASGFKAKKSADAAFWYLRNATTVLELKSGAVVIRNY